MEGNPMEIEKYMRKQYAMSKISAFCSAGMFIIVLAAALILVPHLVHTFDTVDTAMGQLNTAMEDLDTAIEDMGESLESVETVAAGLEELDFEGMNEAITDLKTVVEPLAKLFGKK